MKIDFDHIKNNSIEEVDRKIELCTVAIKQAGDIAKKEHLTEKDLVLDKKEGFDWSTTLDSDYYYFLIDYETPTFDIGDTGSNGEILENCDPRHSINTFKQELVFDLKNVRKQLVSYKKQFKNSI